jgi:murein DD-endopeptidase MepM/ murein hydrolase activator NlpD
MQSGVGCALWGNPELPRCSSAAASANGLLGNGNGDGTVPFLRMWPWPVGSPITQEFGDMFSGYPHRGRDAGVPVGTPVVASAPATVVQCKNDGSFGLLVCLDYHNGLFGAHAHNSELLVNIGDQVQAGQLIAKSGNTGFSTGPHIHFQICVSKALPVDFALSKDPRNFIMASAPQ